MDRDLAILALLFLRRVPLAQTEVPAFNAVLAALERIAASEPPPEPDSSEEDESWAS